MTKTTKVESELVKAVLEGLLDKKGEDIKLLDMRDLEASVANYFIICTGNSHPQVDALADNVEEFAKKATKENPIGIEGRENSEWILLDYSDVVVHIFLRETREFYKLEKLWSDAKISLITPEENS